MHFSKYHALGNDYLVIEHSSGSKPLTVSQIQTICHRNFGVGSDGILYGPLPSRKALFRLKIVNPDGSEAEKSGNGIRIFSRYLYDKKLVGNQTFTLETLGGIVSVTIFKGGRLIQVDMGRVSFLSRDIPINIKAAEAVLQKITVGGRSFTFTGATIGNPHCVIVLPTISPELAKRYGPLLERHRFFPNRTNVQFMKIVDKNNISLELWERGAGYTLSSGSLSSAAAAVAYKLGRCATDITAHMPGGSLSLHVDEDYAIRMTGPVTRVCEGEISAEVFTAS